MVVVAGVAVEDILLGQLISKFGVPERKDPGYANAAGKSQRRFFVLNANSLYSLVWTFAFNTGEVM